MKGVQLLGDRQLSVELVADPVPGPGEVIIEMRAAGLCGSDLRVYRSPAIGGEVAPVIVGHEPCGVVVAAGSKYDDAWVGTRVMVDHHYGCGRCQQCSKGAAKHCLAGAGAYGVTANGADADYMAASTSALVSLGEHISFEDGAMIACCAGTAYVALSRLRVTERDTVAVIGQGPVGLCATVLARAMGARVIATDVVDERLMLAKAHGADDVVNASNGAATHAIAELTAGLGVHAVVECSGSEQGRGDAVRVAALHGRICFVGNGPPARLDVSADLIGKELSCFGSWTFTTGELADCADFVTRTNTRLSGLVTHRTSIEHASTVFAQFDGGDTGKCLFVW